MYTARPVKVGEEKFTTAHMASPRQCRPAGPGGTEQIYLFNKKKKKADKPKGGISF